MIKLEFKNAVVKDDGFGLNVNGESLEKLISIALGTRAGDARCYDYGLPNFKSNCCDITIIINPQPVTTCIEDGELCYSSIQDLKTEAIRRYERIKAENEKAAPEK